jgi:hypothetical protein
VIPDNDEMSTGMEKKEIMGTPDIFWSREPIMGPKGTKENPAIIPSFNSSRCVGLETEQARSAPPPLQQRSARASAKIPPHVRSTAQSPQLAAHPHSAVLRWAGRDLVPAGEGPAAPCGGPVLQARAD